MNYFELSRRHRSAPLGYASWRAYWVEMAIVCPVFLIGMACVAVASLIGTEALGWVTP
jgi:hypothetical protein